MYLKQLLYCLYRIPVIAVCSLVFYLYLLIRDNLKKKNSLIFLIYNGISYLRQSPFFFTYILYDIWSPLHVSSYCKNLLNDDVEDNVTAGTARGVSLGGQTNRDEQCVLLNTVNKTGIWVRVIRTKEIGSH